MRLEIPHPSLQCLANEAERIAGRWFRNRPSPALLVMTGETGVGKTFVAKSLFRFARESAFTAFEKGYGPKSPPIMWVDWPKAVGKFKEGEYGVLDDIGAEHDPSGFCTDKLCQILSTRERRFTIVTSNIATHQWPDRFDKRIADRLLRNSKVVELDGVESYALIA